MAVPTLVTDLSATIASNSPAGGDSPATLDDFQRAHAAFIRQIYDYVVASFTFPGGTSTAPVTEGVAYWNTTTNKLTVGDGAAARTMVDTDSAQTLTNKTLTTPVIAAISNTGTVTLPTATDTLVGRATTDTLTNKTLTWVHRAFGP